MICFYSDSKQDDIKVIEKDSTKLLSKISTQIK